MRRSWFLLAAGCSSPLSEAAPTWHADIQPLVERHCAECHGADGGLSRIPLVDYEDAAMWRDAMALAVEERRMPPWLANEGCTDYQNDLSVPEADRATFVAWAEAGGPEGDPATARPVARPPVPSLERVDASVAMPIAYVPTSKPDDYRCFLMEWPEQEPVYVTGFDFTPGNPDIVHHIITFIADPDDVATFRRLDDADPEPGYTCYGGPGGDVFTLANTGWLGAWAPGSGAKLMPEGYGIRLDPGSVLVQQVHYYTPNGSPEADLSTMDLQFERSPLKWAALQPWTDIGWLLGTGMDIEAGASEVTHTFEYTEDKGGYELRSANLHMHTLGQSGRIEVEHADGSTSCMLDVSRWDFDWQRDYFLQEPVEVGPGDTVRLSCTWSNPTDQNVSWGDGTGDEMCLGVTLLTAD